MDQNTTARAATLLRIAGKYIADNEVPGTIEVDGIETDSIGLSMDLENMAENLDGVIGVNSEMLQACKEARQWFAYQETPSESAMFQLLSSVVTKASAA